MKRALTLLLSAAAGPLLAAALPAASTAAAPTQAATAAPVVSSADPVINWNRFLLELQATPGAQPATVHATYELAVTHAAIYDAVVSIDHSAAPYLTTVRAPGQASIAAAADAAAHDTLVKLYPNERQSVDAQYTASLARVRAGRRKSAGIRVGQRVAAQILAARANDRSDSAFSFFMSSGRPGSYQPTPPALAQPVFTNWATVKPFVLQRAAQFRPPALPPLTSAKYAAAINEVKALGVAQGSTRTADQTQIGQFWNAPIWATWNQIAQTAAVGHHGTLSRNARTFAALNLTLADSTIALYDGKYALRWWRPITAIRSADTDGNPDTVADPTWTPLSPTAPDPSYPGAHATISAAGADVLAAIYGNHFAFNVTSTALPGVQRSFVSFSEAAHEASVSRIFNGNHTRLDEVAGENLGHDVAGFVLGHDLKRTAAARR
jgi:hypothetical protein